MSHARGWSSFVVDKIGPVLNGQGEGPGSQDRAIRVTSARHHIDLQEPCQPQLTTTVAPAIRSPIALPRLQLLFYAAESPREPFRRIEAYLTAIPIAEAQNGPPRLGIHHNSPSRSRLVVHSLSGQEFV